jgi:hypothetical protein
MTNIFWLPHQNRQMKKQMFWPAFLFTVVVTLVLASSQTARSDDATSPGRFKMQSTPSGQYVETYMLDKRTGRLWMLRGQLTDAPHLIACIYQMLKPASLINRMGESGWCEARCPKGRI